MVREVLDDAARERLVTTSSGHLLGRRQRAGPASARSSTGATSTRTSATASRRASAPAERPRRPAPAGDSPAGAVLSQACSGDGARGARIAVERSDVAQRAQVAREAVRRAAERPRAREHRHRRRPRDAQPGADRPGDEVLVLTRRRTAASRPARRYASARIARFAAWTCGWPVAQVVCGEPRRLDLAVQAAIGQHRAERRGPPSSPCPQPAEPVRRHDRVGVRAGDQQSRWGRDPPAIAAATPARRARPTLRASECTTSTSPNAATTSPCVGARVEHDDRRAPGSLPSTAAARSGAQAGVRSSPARPQPGRPLRSVRSHDSFGGGDGFAGTRPDVEAEVVLVVADDARQRAVERRVHRRAAVRVVRRRPPPVASPRRRRPARGTTASRATSASRSSQ